MQTRLLLYSDNRIMKGPFQRYKEILMVFAARDLDALCLLSMQITSFAFLP